jgi:hypothetical protein
MQPTQSTGSHLLLPEGTAAPSGEAVPLTEYSDQSRSRKRLHQICRPVQGQRVLWEHLPSLLGETDLRRTCNSPPLLLSNTSLLLPSLSLLPGLGQMKGADTPFI